MVFDQNDLRNRYVSLRHIWEKHAHKAIDDVMKTLIACPQCGAKEVDIKGVRPTKPSEFFQTNLAKRGVVPTARCTECSWKDNGEMADTIQDQAQFEIWEEEAGFSPHVENAVRDM